MALILTNANLIDYVNPSPIPGARVIIDGRRITQVLSAGVPTINAGDQVLDLGGAYLLPGYGMFTSTRNIFTSGVGQ